MDKATLKSYFQTGAYPTAAQFETLIDEMRVSSDLLDSVVVNADYTYPIPSSALIDKILIEPTGTCMIRIGKTLGGNEHLEDTEITAGEYYSHSQDIKATGSAPEIYISGINSQTTITFYKR